MNVMYTCDNNYVWLMGISVISLFEHNKSINNLTVYLLGENISTENREKLREIGTMYSRRIIVIDVPPFNIPPALVSARWPLSAYTRLFSGQILPDEVDRVLYLDCDTIINGTISELETIDFNGNTALAVKDCISGRYKRNIGLDYNSPYYNAGVILFNVQELRKLNVSDLIEAYMEQYIELINYADQDILNGILVGKIGELDPKYDLMTIDVAHTYEEIMMLRKPTNFYNKEKLENAIQNPIIIHYTTNMLVIRPWFSNSDHPLKNHFLMYKSKSPWKDKKSNALVFNSKEAKVIKLVNHLPRTISICILGLIHSILKPAYIRAKSK